MENFINLNGSLNINLTWQVRDSKLSYAPDEPALKLEMSLSFPDFPEREKRSAMQIISKKQFKTHSPESYTQTTFRYMLSQLLKNLSNSHDLRF